MADFAADVVRPAVYPLRLPLTVEAFHVRGEPIPVTEALAATYEPFVVGGPWGAMWSTTWFRFTARRPDAWAGRETAALIHLGGDDMVGFSAEGLVWDAGGRPLQGRVDGV